MVEVRVVCIHTERNNFADGGTKIRLGRGYLVGVNGRLLIDHAERILMLLLM